MLLFYELILCSVQEAKLALERSGAQFVSPEEFERLKAQQPAAQAAAGA
jgi:hypothetical protein